jgi:hypothetical protein
MKLLKFGALLALAAASATSSVSASSQRRVLDFTLINASPAIIMELYVSPASDDTWGADVLGKDIVKPGEELEIAFSRNETTCMWDLRFVDENNKKLVWPRVNLCEASAITLKYEKGRPTANVR